MLKTDPDTAETADENRYRHRHPAAGRYGHEHTRRWSAKVASVDAFVFMPEYNHGIPAALKNAIDYLHAEWSRKAAGIVSIGGTGGLRAAEQLRLVLPALKVAVVRAQVPLSLAADFEKFSNFRPGPKRGAELDAVLDEVIAWSGALASLRTPRRAEAA